MQRVLCVQMAFLSIDGCWAPMGVGRDLPTCGAKCWMERHPTSLGHTVNIVAHNNRITAQPSQPRAVTPKAPFARMWLRFGVVGLTVTPKAKHAIVYLKYNVNDAPAEVNDASLSSFCLPLGPESQTPKDRMAEEVGSAVVAPHDRRGPSPQVTSHVCACRPIHGSGTPARTQRHTCSDNALQDYTFTLTQGDGSRVQGFCRRFLPPAPRVGSRLRYPQVLCLQCEASWGAFFFKVGHWGRRARGQGGGSAEVCGFKPGPPLGRLRGP